MCDQLAGQLDRNGVPCAAVHGDKRLQLRGEGLWGSHQSRRESGSGGPMQNADINSSLANEPGSTRSRSSSKWSEGGPHQAS
eukprot:2774292-Amphidinium_carterae.1